MKRELELAKEFHHAFNIPVLEKPSLIPERFELRHKMLREEVDEYLKGNKNNDLENVAMELTDILYITYTTILEHGLQDKIPQIFEEVHRANMSKLDNNGKPIYREDGKVAKGPNYKKPDIKEIMRENKK